MSKNQFKDKCSNLGRQAYLKENTPYFDQKKINIFLLSTLLISSLFVLIKVPLVDLAISNFLYPLISIAIVVNNFELKFTRTKVTKYLIYLAIFFFWSIVSAFFSDYSKIALLQSIKMLNYGITFIALLFLTKTYKDNFTYIQIIINFSFILGILGLIEYFNPDLVIFSLLRDFSFYPRVSSLMQNPNTFGVLMAISFILQIILNHRNDPITISHKIIKEKNTLKRCCLLVKQLTFICAISCSGSRNAWFILVIGLGLLVYYKYIRIKVLSIFLFLLVLAILLIPVSQYRLGLGDLSALNLLNLDLFNNISVLDLPSPKGTALSRILLWKKAISEIISHPLLGSGSGVFCLIISGEVFGKAGFSTHNLLLEFLVDLGIPGLSFLLFVIIKLIQKSLRCDRSYYIVLLLFLISQFIDVFLYDSTFMIVSIVYLAIILNTPVSKSYK